MPVLGVTPTNAPPRGKTPRSGVAPRSRQPPATFDSSLAPAAASRPSLSPSCSSASASRPAASAVRESQFCAHLRLILPHCVARAPPAPSEPCPCPPWACNVLQCIYIPSSPSGPLHRKKPQRSAPAHRTPRGSRQRAGIAARGLALPRRQQRDEVVDKWRQAQLPRPARHQHAGNCFY